MWTLAKTARFEASHRLPHHDGKCARLHGHSWVVTVEVSSQTLQASGPQTGMVMDLGRIGAALKTLVEDKLDHHHLNETTGLDSPTSEEVARWIYERLKPALGPILKSVTIGETCTSSARYQP